MLIWVSKERLLSKITPRLFTLGEGGGVVDGYLVENVTGGYVLFVILLHFYDFREKRLIEQETRRVESDMRKRGHKLELNLGLLLKGRDVKMHSDTVKDDTNVWQFKSAKMKNELHCPFLTAEGVIYF